MADIYPMAHDAAETLLIDIGRRIHMLAAMPAETLARMCLIDEDGCALNGQQALFNAGQYLTLLSEAVSNHQDQPKPRRKKTSHD